MTGKPDQTVDAVPQEEPRRQLGGRTPILAGFGRARLVSGDRPPGSTKPSSITTQDSFSKYCVESGPRNAATTPAWLAVFCQGPDRKRETLQRGSPTGRHCAGRRLTGIPARAGMGHILSPSGMARPQNMKAFKSHWDLNPARRIPRCEAVLRHVV